MLFYEVTKAFLKKIYKIDLKKYKKLEQHLESLSCSSSFHPKKYTILKSVVSHVFSNQLFMPLSHPE